MRSLPSPKVALFAAFLLLSVLLPGPAASADDGSTLASTISSLVAELLSLIVGPDDAASLPNPAADAPLTSTESFPQILPGG